MTPPPWLRRHAALLCLPLLGCAAWLQARAVSHWADALLAAAPAVRASLPVDDFRAPRAARPPRNAYAILHRNPFDSATGPLDTPRESSSPPPLSGDEPSWPQCSGGLRVVAIASAERGTSLAVLRSDLLGGASSSMIRRTGGQVGTGRILAIRSDRVYLETDSGPCTVRMFAPPQAQGPGAVGRPDQSTGAGATANANTFGIRRLAATEFEVDRAVVDRIIEDPKGLMSVRVKPESPDGLPPGLRLAGIRPDSMLAALGLNNGDRIETVNGYEIANPEIAMVAYARLRTAERLSIRLNRGGSPITVEVRIR